MFFLIFKFTPDGKGYMSVFLSIYMHSNYFKNFWEKHGHLVHHLSPYSLRRYKKKKKNKRKNNHQRNPDKSIKKKKKKTITRRHKNPSDSKISIRVTENNEIWFKVLKKELK